MSWIVMWVRGCLFYNAKNTFLQRPAASAPNRDTYPGENKYAKGHQRRKTCTISWNSETDDL